MIMCRLLSLIYVTIGKCSIGVYYDVKVTHHYTPVCNYEVSKFKSLIFRTGFWSKLDSYFNIALLKTWTSNDVEGTLV